MKLKSNKGITLVALVITIVVLLILAGVTLSLTLGQNGIITKAQLAQSKMDEAAFKEDLELKLINSQLQASGELFDDLKAIYGEENVEQMPGISDGYYLENNGKIYTVYSDGDVVEGKVEGWDGTTVESPTFDASFNWEISKPSQLVFLQQYVNNGNSLTEELAAKLPTGVTAEDIALDSEKTVYLMNNIDLGARQVDGTLTTPGREWTPIGPTNETQLQAAVDGKDHFIKGIYVNSTKNRAGLIGTSANTIKNLIIKDSYIKSTGNVVAGVVSVSKGGIIESCKNINTIVITYGYTAGGIVGQSQAQEIKNCNNYGTIEKRGSGGNSAAGGICGLNISAYTHECKNYGNISSSSGCNIGGICGQHSYTGYSNPLMENCYNFGSINITNGEDIGGLVGLIPGGGTVSNCYNKGIISSNSSAKDIGGIVGRLGNNKSTLKNTINNCYNLGTIKGGTKIGGIVGLMDKNCDVSNVYNKGIIEDYTTDYGNIVGNINTANTNTISNAYYLSTGTFTGAIGNGTNPADDNENHVKGTTTDFATYEEFIDGIDALVQADQTE